MSQITSQAEGLFCYPAQFPSQGRLPAQEALIGKNCHQQESHERAYRQELCLAANRRVEPPCCKTLHISLFFDGTGNNLNNDLYLSDPKHPTNIARLFRATIGTGYAGGVPDNKEPLDSSDSVSEKYFKYYIPGVGTPFTEIGDLEYSTFGLAAASYGEDRINWALLRIIDTLQYVLTSKGMSNAASLKSIDKMNTTWARFGFGGAHNRYEEFTQQLKELDKRSALRRALAPAELGKPKLLGIKLYIYGFSRGAAEARAFVKWLSELLPKPDKESQKPEQCLAVNDLKIPISVEFLGLLDTVASVGVAHIAPVAEGHMAWADGTQELPDEATYGGLIKKCVHLVSAHEQRLCFPLDSIRRTNGQYPANSVEVFYPGMHSDLGGGYPPGDQGKANGKDDGLLLSQIALHELYASAFSIGAPLKVSGSVLETDLKKDIWRGMSLDVENHFIISPDLITRFNAWREVTLGLPAAPQDFTDEQAAQFDPIPAKVTLESAIDNQIAWITAWRINRYADKTLFITPFYQRASDADSEPTHMKASKKEYEIKVDYVKKRRQDQRIAQRPGDPAPVLFPGTKDFDPKLDQTQLKQAAIEFGEDYREDFRSYTSMPHFILETIPLTPIYLLRSDDVGRDFLLIKGMGKLHVDTLFPPQGEASNATQPSGLVRALFDDQVHDSRAWFLHYALGSREPWGSYFLYRMIYFGEKCNKELSLMTVAGNVAGALNPTKSVIFRFLPKSAKEKVSEAVDATKTTLLKAEPLDFNTQQPLTMVPDAGQVTAFTHVPGVTTHQQTQLIEQQRYEQTETMIALQRDKINALPMS
ncbi:T6SS phospholipase effector Tle1-like catalytic domain-containing protein [Rahnella sp. PAMC 25559]|uniref:T6SS phospholipase effector Tle1-like catalytic domain-containing protein n=1 Tax=Rahnella sp. PAMC 25559 TaxID=3423225 RepID=UPI003D66B8F3